MRRVSDVLRRVPEFRNVYETIGYYPEIYEIYEGSIELSYFFASMRRYR